MFKDKFIKEMSQITPTNETKAKVLEKIEEQQAPVTVKAPAKKRWIAAAAMMVAVIVVAVGVFNPSVFGNKDVIVTEANEEETVSKAVASQSIAVSQPSSKEGTASQNIAVSQPSSEEGTASNSQAPVISHKKGEPTNVSYSQIYGLFNHIYEETVKEKVELTIDEYYAKPGGAIKGSDDVDTDMPRDDGYVVDDSAEDFDDKAVAEDVNGAVEGSTAQNNTTGSSTKEEYSGTNVQVENVDEADVVKTDGKYIYTLSILRNTVEVVKAEKGKMTSVSEINLSNLGNIAQTYKYSDAAEMFLGDNRLTVVMTGYNLGTMITVLDISNPAKIRKIKTVTLSGEYLSSRLIDNYVYVFSTEYFYTKPDENDICSYVPTIEADGERCAVPEDDIYIFEGEIDRSYLTVSSINITNGEIVDTKATLGGGETVYANTESLYVAARECTVSYVKDSKVINSFKDKTRLIRFDIKNGKITAAAEGMVDGTPLNQFSMDEYKGNFRIVTTIGGSFGTTNAVFVLNRKLEILGSITDVAEGEKVYSVRFMGDTGYFVTFRQTDPLFAVDLSNPKNPKLLSALKIPGFSNYLHPFGDGLLLGIGVNADENTGATSNIKLSMFDISDPANVFEKHKIFADCYDSTVGTDHKAILVSKDKNIIGFPSNNGTYYVYSYNSDVGFTLKGKLNIPRDVGYYMDLNTRGIFIGDYFYLCSTNGINSYNLLDFSFIETFEY